MLLTIGALSVLLWGVRIGGVSDLIDKDQTRPAMYTLDIVLNGAWAVQRDYQGDIASKPPLPVWISAIASILTGGEVERWSLALPSLIGVGGVAVFGAWLGQRKFGGMAGVWAGLGVLCTISGEKLIALVRTDGFFALTVALGGVAAWRAWRTGRGWMWFWLAGAAATLTKGPLGLILAGIGLLAIVWEWRTSRKLAGAPPSDARRARATGVRVLLDHGAGICLFLLLCGGWFALASHTAGQDFIDKVIGDELVGHAVESGKGAFPLSNFYKQPLYFIAYYAPLSVLTILGLIRTVRTPERDPELRSLERFLWCWFVGGLLIFTAAPHQRPDHLAPLWLPMALLGGRELDRILNGLAVKRRVAIAIGVAAIVLSGSILHRHVLAQQDPLLQAEAALKAAADAWNRMPESREPLIHTTDHAMFRVSLGVFRASNEFEEAAESLARGDASLVSVSTGAEELQRHLTDRGLGWEEVVFFDAPTQRHKLWIWRIHRDDGTEPPPPPPAASPPASAPPPVDEGPGI